MPIVKLKRLSLHCQQAGHGPDLILIHGLFANLAFWYLTILPELAAKFRVTVYDLPGHGYSEMPPSGYTPAAMAADLHDLLDHFDIKHAHIVGHSFGGAIALQYSVLHPERVSSLTLADARISCLQSPLPPRNSLYWRMLRKRLRQAGIQLPENLPRVAYSWFEDLARVRQQHDTYPADVRTMVALLKGWNSTSRLAQRWEQLMQTTSASKELSDASELTVEQIRQVQLPTMTIYGEYSGCLATLRGLETNLRNYKTVIVPGVGHFHPILRPKIFAGHLRNFIFNMEE